MLGASALILVAPHAAAGTASADSVLPVDRADAAAANPTTSPLDKPQEADFAAESGPGANAAQSPALSASAVSDDSATLTLTGHSGKWWMRRIAPTLSACEPQGTAYTKSLSGLSGGSDHIYVAFDDSMCNYTDYVASADFSTRGVSLSTVSLIVPEGSTAEYSVKLTTAPTSDVTVTVSVSGDADITADTDTGTPGSQNTLTFTATTWSTAQTVTLSAADDTDKLYGTATVAHQATSSDANYNTASTSLTASEGDNDVCQNTTAVANAASGTLVDDCNTLLAARDTLAGTSTAIDDWATTLAMNSWRGVTVTNGKLTHLSLTTTDQPPGTKTLDGTLPNTLGNLARLTHLRFVDNRIFGPIPSTLGSLSNLEVLDLRNNPLSGPIPAALGSLSKLRYLNFGAVYVSGSIPSALGSLTGLRDLYISANPRLAGTLPASLGSLSNLQTLHISSGKSIRPGGVVFSGSIPSTLGSLTKLRRLELEDAGLTGSIPASLGSLPNLERLQLWGNELSGSIPASLGSLTKLVHLYLMDNDLSGSIPAALGSLTKLTRMSMYGNNLTGCVPAALSSFIAGNTGINPQQGSVRLAACGSPTPTPTPTPTPALAASDVTQTAATLTISNHSGGWHYKHTTPSSGTCSTAVSGTTADLTGLTAGTGYTYTAYSDSACATQLASTAFTTASTGPRALVASAVTQSGATLTLNGYSGKWWLRRIAPTLSACEPQGTAYAKSLTGLSGGSDHIYVAFDDSSCRYWDYVASADFSTRGVHLSASTLIVPEGGTADYAVKLTTAPTSDVTVTVSVSGDADITADTDTGTPGSQNTLTFTATTWSTAQTVTLSAADDTDKLYGTATVAHQATSSDANYNTASTSLTASEGDNDVCQNTTAVANAASGTLVDDCNTLLAARDTLAGTSTAIDDWATTLAMNSWRGVTVTNGKLTHLSLDTTDLPSGTTTVNGTLPNTLGNLARLTHLGFKNNSLHGPIPGTLGSLSNLEVLSLRNNPFSGPIPAALGSLSKLRYLNFGAVYMHGTIPRALSSLASLERLYLTANPRMTGSIPTSLSSLAKLRTLYIAGLNLSGSIPSELSSLANLEALGLKNNGLTGSIPSSLGSLTKLEALYLGGNELSGSIPGSLGGLTKLTSLYLQDNDLSGSIPSTLGSVTDFIQLAMWGNALTGCVPAALSSFIAGDLKINPQQDSVRLAVCSAPAPSLTASGVTYAGATLTIANRTGDWHHKRTAPTAGTCSSAVSGATADLTGLTASTGYTYTAYSDSACTTQLASTTFTTAAAPVLAASDVTQTAATLTIANHSGDWHHKHTTPSNGTCSSAVTGTTANVTTLSGATAYTFAAYSDSSCATLLAAAPSFTTPDLTASVVTHATATLTISGHTTKWWHKQTTPAAAACTEIAASTPAADLTGLTAGTSYTYTAYDASGCNAADKIAEESFTTAAAPALAASKVTQTTATLTIANHSGDWHHKHTTPSNGTCSSAVTGTTADLSDLDGGTAYTFAAYSDSNCSTPLATAPSFTTLDLTASGVTYATATLTISGHTAKWWHKRTTPANNTCTEIAAGTPTADLSGLAAGTSYTYTAYDASGCNAADKIADESFTTAAAPVLTAGAITQTTATLTLANWDKGWWHARTTATHLSCVPVADGAYTSDVSGLRAAKTYAWAAYSASGCNAADKIADVSFTTPAEPTLAASAVTETSATLTITDHGGSWHYKHTSPQGGACSAAQSGKAASVTRLTGGIHYTFGAYSDSACTDELASTDLSTVGLTATSVTTTEATLTIVNWDAAWWYSQSKAGGGSECVEVSAGTSTARLTNLEPDTSYLWPVWSADPCNSNEWLADVIFGTLKQTLQVHEGGTTTYSIKLGDAPTANVTVTIEVEGDEDITVRAAGANQLSSQSESQNTLTFTTKNWSVAQRVVVSASKDVDADGGTATITHTAASADPAYDGKSLGSVTVTEADKDTAPTTPPDDSQGSPGTSPGASPGGNAGASPGGNGGGGGGGGSGRASSIRLAGADRYATAAAVGNKFVTLVEDASAATGMRRQVDTAIVASGQAFPDALAASALARTLNAPVLLTPKTSLAAEVKAFITRHRIANVVIVGGPAAVSTDVEAAIDALPEVDSVTRHAGPDRYATAALIAQAAGTPGLLCGTSAPTVFVTTGRDYPDALIAGPLAYRGRHPLVLTAADELPRFTAEYLRASGATQAVVVGSPAAVSPAVIDAIEALGLDTVRVTGSDRADASVQFAARYTTFSGPSCYRRDTVGLATGWAFPDLLSAAALLGHYGAPLLLTHPDGVPQPLIDYAASGKLQPDFDQPPIVTIGGRNAVPADHPTKLLAALPR